jgi:ABC-type sugar transport system permease subunit
MERVAVLLPGFLIYLGFTFYPILETVRTSFYEGMAFSARRDWIGLQKLPGYVLRRPIHQRVFTQPDFHFVLCVLPVLLGLLLASLLTRKHSLG